MSATNAESVTISRSELSVLLGKVRATANVARAVAKLAHDRLGNDPEAQSLIESVTLCLNFQAMLASDAEAELLPGSTPPVLTADDWMAPELFALLQQHPAPAADSTTIH